MRRSMISLLLLFSVSLQAATKRDVEEVYLKLFKANPSIKKTKLKVVPMMQEDGTPVINAMNEDAGKNIYMSSAMLHWLRNKDEVAMILGHELAHNKWKTEQRADEWGAKYVLAAGFDYCKGAQVFKRKLFHTGDMPVHPPGKDRYKAMRCK